MQVASKELKMVLRQLPMIFRTTTNITHCSGYDKEYLKNLYQEILYNTQGTFSANQAFILKKRFFEYYRLSVIQICRQLYICPATFYIEQNLALEKCRPYFVR